MRVRGGSVALLVTLLAACSGPGEATSDAGVTAARSCLGEANGAPICTACGEGEICFTQLRCSPGAACALPEGAPAEGWCVRGCAVESDCAEGDHCEARTFFGCGDFNGARKVCCNAVSCPG